MLFLCETPLYWGSPATLSNGETSCLFWRASVQACLILPVVKMTIKATVASWNPWNLRWWYRCRHRSKILSALYGRGETKVDTILPSSFRHTEDRPRQVYLRGFHMRLAITTSEVRIAGSACGLEQSSRLECHPTWYRRLHTNQTMLLRDLSIHGTAGLVSGEMSLHLGS